MYEWEKDLTDEQISLKIFYLQAEVKRIANVTLRGNFTDVSDRKYWESRLGKLNSELSVLEGMRRKNDSLK